MTYIKSPLNYIGGKYKLLDDIIPRLPNDINQFVDLFAGGGSVFINSTAREYLVNDNLYPLIDIFKGFSSQPIDEILKNIDQLISKYSLSKINDEGFYNLRNDYNSSPSFDKLLVLIAFGFNHQIRFNSKHEFNNPFGKNRSSFNPRTRENIIKFSNRIKELNITFSSEDYRQIDLSNISKHDFVYCDPPYLITSGTYNDGKRGFTGWSETEEVDLYRILDQLNSNNVRFMLSNVMESKGRVNQILKDWSREYTVIPLDKSYKNSNYQRTKNGSTREVIVINY